MSAQDRTLDQYHELMQINAVSHLMRAARQLGVFAELRKGQRTLQQLGETLSLDPGSLNLLLDSLVAIGIIERYQDDHALAQATQLLCLYDDDLGDARWDRLVDRVRGEGNRNEHDDQQRFDHLAATQWIHTPAAMQAAEILNIGGEDEASGPHILDLGCGSAVWSCAMAHRDPASMITAVDTAGAIQAANKTAESIGLGDRFEAIASDPLAADVPRGEYDLVLIAQRLHCLSLESGRGLLARATAACKAAGRVVVIDLFRGPAKPNLAETVEALKLELETRGGSMRSLEQTQEEMRRVGLEQLQFTFLAASRVNLGLAVGIKPSRPDLG